MIERMREAGVTTAITVGCDLEDSAHALEAAEQYGLFASAGIHPHEAKDAPQNIAAALAPMLDDRRTVAIGETGLDYFYAHSPPQSQQRVLREQIRIARRRATPLIFHHRDAFDDFCAILRDEWDSGMRGVVHCFTGDLMQARTYVNEFGLYLGIGGVITFKSAGAVREAVTSTGADHLVLETDSPYLAPVPRRGERNEPAFLGATAQMLAELLRISREELAAITDRNARGLFGLPAG